MVVDETVMNSTTSTQNDQIEEPPTDPTSNIETESSASKPKATSKRSKRLAEKSIEHGTEIDPNLLPQSK